ncbi:GAF domain-containing sensor histidine kinase [Catenuloplanes atrovinosus]|uniref:histidine kinase n=1 Tax=Catenuloplanes atrovinosus TaxID=137266 RepID=A0AAE4CDP4_9ACTN|nr:GAF domain-containing sensor histidine kinase [Catenuloplanes atrovinosus]MDR7280647.1 signal transduction histidine kinase [Catenuloplanes atrovinosus]
MEAAKPENEAGRLATLHDLEVLDTEPEQEFDDIVALASRVCGVPMSLVSLIDADRQWFKAKIGLELDETSREVSFCAHAILGKDLLVVPDVHTDRRFSDNPMVTGDPGVRFYAGAPLVTTDGFALGTLCVVDSEPRRLNLDQLQALRALSRQVTAQLELRRYAKALNRTVARLQDMERRRDDFANLLAGDLRAPLHEFGAYLASVSTDREPDRVLAEALVRTTRRYLDPMRQLVAHLLAMADPENEGYEALHLRQVDLSRITERAVRAVRPIAATKEIWILHGQGPCLPIYADPVRLEQVLMHLLFAAVKFTPPGGRVRVSTEAEGGPAVRLDDLDQPDTERPDLFTHLYRSAVARPDHGGGPDRGLAVAKRILDVHHATLALSDRPGEGTSLRVVFPPVTAAPEAVERAR